MGNEVRRSIVKALARGPLSMKSLVEAMDVSRQAILKQINTLEKKGLIFHEKEDSSVSRKGPSPHIYQLSRFFTFVYEMNPSYMKPRVMELKLLPGDESPEADTDDLKADAIQFESCFRDLIELDDEILTLEKKHQEIYMKKNEIIKKAVKKIKESLDDFEEREVLYYFLKYPKKAMKGVTIKEIASILDIRHDFVEAVMKNLEKLSILEKVQDQFGIRYLLKGLRNTKATS